ncbi:DUF397 domain-containing protein [Streptomyces sp. NPDC001604]|uniref:DUF397 domain-containing protein n=1 Tax=Streptomyces sp. NPDC001604 TaxID=3364593 RepID=UPI0036B1F034
MHYRGWRDHEDMAGRLAAGADTERWGAGGNHRRLGGRPYGADPRARPPDTLRWSTSRGLVASAHKSGYSQGGNDCLSVTDAYAGVVPARDSKNPDGPKLAFGTAAWAAFVEGVASMT